MTKFIFIDPKIRDNVFVPLIILMFFVTILRFYLTKILNAKSNPLTEDCSISQKTLKNTMFELDADMSRELPEGTIDLNKSLESIKPDVYCPTVVNRSTQIRKACEFLPEHSVKLRKAYFCKDEVGQLTKKVPHNPMGDMMNPNMMGGMLKQNL